MILRSLALCCRSIASSSSGIQVQLVGKKSDVALLTIPGPSTPDIPNQIADTIASHDEASHIRSTIIAITSSFDPFSLQSYGSFLKISDNSKPTIALIDGDLTGVATELAMSCDLIYASDRSTFTMNQILAGSMPGSGGTQRLTRAVGKSLAMEMILAAQPISADEAKQAGLISKVYPPSRLLKAGIAAGERAASKSPLIQPLVKEAVRVAGETSLEGGCRFESLLFELTFGTADRREGMTAHLEGRRPEWKGE